MKIKKSKQMNGWIGFFIEDEHDYLEEFLSVKSIEKAEEIVNQLQKDLQKLKSLGG